MCILSSFLSVAVLLTFFIELVTRIGGDRFEVEIESQVSRFPSVLVCHFVADNTA